MAMPLALAAVHAIRFLYGVGRKVSDVIVDETVMRELRVPRPRLPTSCDVLPQEVARFFQGAEGAALLSEMEDVRTAWEAWKVAGDDHDDRFTKILRPVFQASAACARTGASPGEQAGFLVVKAYLDGARPVNTPFQRILGEVVNQGLDFLSTTPSALGAGAKLTSVLTPVIQGLAEVDLAEADEGQILRGSLGAILGGLEGLAQVKLESEGLRKMSSGLTGALRDALEGSDAATLDEYFRLNGPVIQGLVRSVASTVSESPALFFDEKEPLVKSLVLPLASRVSDDRKNLFTKQTAAELLGVAIANAGGLAKLPAGQRGEAVLALLDGLSTSIESAGAMKTIDLGVLYRDIAARALPVVAANIGLLGKGLAVDAARIVIDAMIGAVEKPDALFSQEMLAGWVGRAMEAVAGNAALRDTGLLGKVVSASARAVAADPNGLFSSRGRTLLLAVVLDAVERHGPASVPMLDDILPAVMAGVAVAPVAESVVLEMVRGAVDGVVSAKIEGLKVKPVAEAVETFISGIALASSKGVLDQNAVLAQLPALLVEHLVIKRRKK